MSRLVANLLLLLAAAIWGAAFVAQSTAMKSIGPLWFVAIRFVLAAIVIVPFALREGDGRDRRCEKLALWRLDRRVSVFGALLQQLGMLVTSVTNAGFLTSLYVLTTPILGFVLFRERPHRVIWPGAALALAGTWLLGGGIGQLNWGDALMTVSAVAWGMQILLLGRGSRATGRPLLLSAQQFIVTAAIALLVALLFEPISLAAVRGAAVELLYAGILSGGLAFALQAIGQRHTPNADAAIILAAEAPLAAMFGIALLGEQVSAVGAFGCALIFAAILLVQLAPEFGRWRSARSA